MVNLLTAVQLLTELQILQILMLQYLQILRKDGLVVESIESDSDSR